MYFQDCSIYFIDYVSSLFVKGMRIVFPSFSGETYFAINYPKTSIKLSKRDQYIAFTFPLINLFLPKFIILLSFICQNGIL